MKTVGMDNFSKDFCNKGDQENGGRRKRTWGQRCYVSISKMVNTRATTGPPC